MKISSHFSVYVLLSCLTLFMAVAFNLHVKDDDIYNYLATVFGLRPTYVADTVQTGKFTQRLDHYNRTEYRHTFQQNYFFNDKYYDDKVEEPTVLLVVAALAQMDEDRDFFNDEIYVEFAKRSHALMITLEPRFYGESQPFDDLSTKYLFYLNTEQTLADLALFIKRGPEVLNREHQINIPPNAKWVTTGKEYGGSLAAWFRLKYPHYAEAAVTVGAPMWVMPSYNEYFDSAERSFYHDEVLDLIVGVLKSLKEKIENTKRPWKEHKDDLDTIFTDFKMCVKLYREEEEEKAEEGKHKEEEKEKEKEEDEDKKNAKPKSKLIQQNVDLMFFALTFELATITKSVDPYFKEFRDKAMEILKDEKLNSYDKVKNAVLYVLSLTRDKCLENDYQKNVHLLKDTDFKNVQNPDFLPDLITKTMGKRNKFFQRCFEFGRFETANVNNAFYDYVPLSFYLTFCNQVFKPSLPLENIDAAIFATNLFYGAIHYGGRNVLFINRKEDPIITIEIRESKKQKEIVAVTMKNLPASFLRSTNEDKERLKGYYNRIFKAFMEWVGKYNEKTESDDDREENAIDVYEDDSDQTDDIFEIEQFKYREIRKKLRIEQKVPDEEDDKVSNNTENDNVNRDNAVANSHKRNDVEENEEEKVGNNSQTTPGQETVEGDKKTHETNVTSGGSAVEPATEAKEEKYEIKAAEKAKEEGEIVEGKKSENDNKPDAVVSLTSIDNDSKTAGSLAADEKPLEETKHENKP